MLGLLVHGDNHFIVAGPLPSLAAARRLAWRWEVPAPGITAAPEELPWRIVTKAFREELEWAVVLEGSSPRTAAVEALLAELEARAVAVHRGPGPWLAAGGSGGWPGREWPGEEA